MYVEKYVEDPRHVEIQVLADRHGGTIHLGERDCTLQRRHQKVLEEAPSPAVSAELRARMGAMAVDAARAVGYVGAGTVECLLDRHGEFFFLEMNTRIQVEHPVTELVTGFDLVRAQIEIAAGAELPLAQADVELRGHAFECRINAEDAGAGFRPAPGRVVRYAEPAGPGVRVDSGIEEGDEVVGLYDPLIAKLCVWDSDRERARLRMLRALDELVVEGVPTLVPLHRMILRHPSFIAGETCAGLIEGELADALEAAGPAEPALPAAEQRRYAVEVDGARYEVSVALPADELLAAERRRRAERRSRGSQGGAGGERVTSPMQGTVLRVEVAEGDSVEAGQVLVIVEAMKMENEIRAHLPGVVEDLGGRGRRCGAQRAVAAARRRGVSTPVLSTPRLLLREWRPEDLAPFAALNADPRVMEHFPGAARPPSERRARATLGGALRAPRLRPVGRRGAGGGAVHRLRRARRARLRGALHALRRGRLAPGRRALGPWLRDGGGARERPLRLRRRGARRSSCRSRRSGTCAHRP